MDDRKFKNPFNRQWMINNCAAAGQVQGNFLLKAIIAGGITGGLEALLSYPAQYTKTQLQLDEKSGNANQYNSVINVIKKTIKEKGFFGLYRGLSVILFLSIPKIGVRFGTFEYLKNYASDENGVLSHKMLALCGFGAGFNESIIVVTPMENVKVKFIHDQRLPISRYRGFLHGVSLIINEHGFKGLYKGVVPTIIRQGSNQGVRFYVVDTLKDVYRGGDPSVSVPTPLVGVIGVIAGAASVYCNMPIDVVKTRMQGLQGEKYTGTWDCLKKIWKHEGPFALYKGTKVRLLEVCIDVAFTFMLYDSIMEFFKKVWPD